MPGSPVHPRADATATDTTEPAGGDVPVATPGGAPGTASAGALGSALGAAASEAGLRRLAGAGVVGILLADFSGRVLDANAEFLHLIGYTREDLAAGLRWDAITPPEWRGVDEQIMRALEATGAAKPVEKEYVHKDGRRVPVLVGGALLARETTETVAFVVDLSRQRAAEAGRREAEQRLQLALDAAALGTFYWDLVTGEHAWDDRLYAVYGVAPGTPVTGALVAACVHPDDRARAAAEFARALDPAADAPGGAPPIAAPGKRRYTMRYRVVPPDAVGETARAPSAGTSEPPPWSVRHVAVTARVRFAPATDAPTTDVPATDAPATDGIAAPPPQALRAVRVTGTVQDVTAQVEAEAALAASEALFRHTFEQAAVGVAHVGLDGRWLRLNARLAEIVGYTRDELLARTFQDVTHPDDLDADVAHVEALLRGEAERYAMDKRYRRKDGGTVWVRLTVSLVRDAAGMPDYFISVVEDIDARRRAEAENARYAALLTHITDAAVAVEGPELRVTYLNAEGERVFRRPAAECVGRPVLALFPDTAELPFYVETRRAAVEQRPSRFEAYYPAFAAWYEVRVYPTAFGGVPGALALFQDVTERRAVVAHLEEARAAAEAGSRAKSSFIAAMSHELRTPINAIQGYVDLLELGLAGPLSEQQGAYLARTRLAGRALLAVVNDVLDVARVEAGKATAARRVAWAAPAVDAAVALVQPQALAKGVALVGACPADLAYWGDEARVQQVLVNLVANAVKFTPAGGRVTVTGARADAGPRAAGTPASALAADAGWIALRVQDTGVGIAAPDLDRVFEAFEQAEAGYTRAQGGAGLGLTISRHFARLMGGDVTAESVPGEGSSFMLVLPAVAAAEVRAHAPGEAERRGAARFARGLGLVGDAALGEIERILDAYRARLRTDPGTPSAHALSDAALSDHTASFLADVAQTLAQIEAARGGASDMLRDGTAIQRFVSERHGALRARLGWGADELRREFAILREEIAVAVRRRVAELAAADPGAPERTAPVDEALALLARFAEHSERASLEGHARASLPG